jgi:hypothetical protein
MLFSRPWQFTGREESWRCCWLDNDCFVFH